jgi:hypothetical protein
MAQMIHPKMGIINHPTDDRLSCGVADHAKEEQLMSAKLHSWARLGSIAAFALLAFNHPVALPKQASVPDDLFRWAGLNEAEL